MHQPELSIIAQMTEPTPSAAADLARLGVTSHLRPQPVSRRERRAAERAARKRGQAMPQPIVADPFLAKVLPLIQHYDEADDYERRNKLVIAAVSHAAAIGLAWGFQIDPAAPEWPVASIELPTGQVSWNLPQHMHAWDGHTTAEKYARIAEYVGA